MQTKKYSMEFLTWVDRCLFPDDFREYLVEHDICPVLAGMVVRVGQELGPISIVRIWQKFMLVHKHAPGDPELRKVIQGYLDEYQDRWDTFK